MLNFFEKILRRLSWEYRSFVSLLRSFSFESSGSRMHLGWDCSIVGACNISIGDNFIAHDRNRIEAISKNGSARFNPKIQIGDNVIMNYGCHIGAINFIKIGNNVLLASNIYISDHDHGHTNYEDMRLPPVCRNIVSKGPVIIEDDVWVGEGVAILGNVTIGKNSIIAAHAVVTKDVPPFSVVAGVPAKVIKKVTQKN
jgi:acetyltransferase-like isoleucine patch superfamily enzyme